MLLDDYLRAVVPDQMGSSRPIEALKAQAIACRSYAVTTRRHTRDGFDLCTAAHCLGWEREPAHRGSDRAVDETANIVAASNGRIVIPPFHDHCDGRTRSGEEVWSGQIPYCRSVPCDCGYSSLSGHGVGMCQRGAVAMAEAGLAAEAILTHYYTGIEAVQATPTPRDSFRRSIVLGETVDRHGQHHSGLHLVLEGPEGSLASTIKNGRFWFSRLPAGKWALRLKGKPPVRGSLVTDGRNTLELQVVVPDAPVSIASMVPLGHPRKLIGTLGHDGIPVTVTDPTGSRTTVLSGSAADYDPGGFVVPLVGAGTYRLHVLDHSFDLEIGDGGLWIHLTVQT